MKFVDLLKGNSFECELITEDYETQYSFGWDGDDNAFEVEGLEKFKKILNSDAKITKIGNIMLLDKTITYEELEEFTSSIAGYCSVHNYNKWFTNKVI